MAKLKVGFSVYRELEVEVTKDTLEYFRAVNIIRDSTVERLESNILKFSEFNTQTALIAIEEVESKVKIVEPNLRDSVEFLELVEVLD